MKKSLLISFLLFICVTLKVSAQYEGTFGVGTHINYGIEFKTPGAGIHATCFLTNNIRLTPSFTYFLPKKDQKIWQAESDIHYIIPVSWTASIYPIAGLNFTNLKLVNEGKNKLGGNIGIGIQQDIAYKIMLNFEMKYQYIKDYSQMFFMAAIGFWF